MQHEIKVQKSYSDTNIESEVIKKISRERFFGELQDQNIDFKHLVKNFKDDVNGLGKFNFFLRMIKQNYHINIFESILFLEEEGYKVKAVGALLSSDNKFILKTELNEKFKTKKVEPSILEKFIIE